MTDNFDRNDHWGFYSSEELSEANNNYWVYSKAAERAERYAATTIDRSNKPKKASPKQDLSYKDEMNLLFGGMTSVSTAGAIALEGVSVPLELPLSVVAGLAIAGVVSTACFAYLGYTVDTAIYDYLTQTWEEARAHEQSRTHAQEQERTRDDEPRRQFIHYTYYKYIPSITMCGLTPGSFLTDPPPMPAQEAYEGLWLKNHKKPPTYYYEVNLPTDWPIEGPSPVMIPGSTTNTGLNEYRSWRQVPPYPPYLVGPFETF